MRTLVVILMISASVLYGAAGEKVVLADPEDGRLDVPGYYWYYGCGPTAAGMIIGFWQDQGYDNLIPGDPAIASQWEKNKGNIKRMIASAGHIRDYYSGMSDLTGYGLIGDDRVATDDDPLHADDCVADFMMASRDPLRNGVSWTAYIYRGLKGYVESRGYGLCAGGTVNYDQLEAELISEIDAGRPMILYMDTTYPPTNRTDGYGDHYVVAVGYDDTGDEFQIAYLDGYSTNVLYADELTWHVMRPFAYGSTEWLTGMGITFRMFTESEAGWGSGGDVNGDGSVDGLDVDLVVMASTILLYDLSGDEVVDEMDLLIGGDVNGDGVVDAADAMILQLAVEVFAELHLYDVDMNGQITQRDFDLMVSRLVEVGGSGGMRGTLAADVDLSGTVDIGDFVILKQNYNRQGSWSRGDINFDGKVDIDDFVLLKQSYGKSR